GGGLTPNSVGRVISSLGRKAGIFVDKSQDKFATAHDLRRSFGTRWSKRVKSAVLQKLMRHTDIKTTMDYYVDQDADDLASDFWRGYGNGPETGPLVTLLVTPRNPAAKKKPAPRHKVGAGSCLANRDDRI
ncbi:MAG: site-specific integrase, partial [Planctomycetes bacterium]|nr:site-specific integrase [Planctomycetota bacterium]